MICTPEEITGIAGEAIASYAIKIVSDIEVIRHAVTEIARDAGMAEERSFDFILCLSEAATNALKHAHGGVATIHVLEDALLAVVADRGPGIPAINLPEVVLKRGYSTASSLGMGYQEMLTMADTLYLATGPHGTMVGIKMALQAREQPASITIIADVW